MAVVYSSSTIRPTKRELLEAELGEGVEVLGSYRFDDPAELGPRWVYDGTTDPVALACFRRALVGEQEQAVVELWEDGRLVGTSEPTARLTASPAATPTEGTVRIAADLNADPGAGPALVASWDGGEAVVALLDD